MAIGALVPQSRDMYIVFLVASDAVFGCFLEHGGFMALLTLNFCVLAQKGITAFVMIKPGWFFPATLAVATCAVLAQGFLVFIVLAMAGVAILAQFDTVKVTGVARHAGCRAMFAAQYILGVRIVIESRRFPLFHTVTSLAFVTKLAFVPLVAVVFLFVTANASTWSILVVTRLVTISTLCIRVFTLQRKPCGAVVKTRVFPVAFVVAIGTLCTQ
jgi:hypothetical protein